MPDTNVIHLVESSLHHQTPPQWYSTVVKDRGLETDQSWNLHCRVPVCCAHQLLVAPLIKGGKNPHGFKLLRELNDIIHVKYLTVPGTSKGLQLKTVLSRGPLTIN